MGRRKDEDLLCPRLKYNNKNNDFNLGHHSYEEVLTLGQILQLKDEFSRLKESCYLDHAGATLYSKSQLESAMTELQENLFSNPHSRNPSSSITTDATDHVRQRVLAHFGTNDDEYSVIFTSCATAALKLLAESFSFNEEGIFAYLEENHTSVVGMREYLLKNRNGPKHKNSSTSSVCCEDSSTSNNGNGHVYCVSKYAMEQIMMNSPLPHYYATEVDVNGVSNSTSSTSNGPMTCKLRENANALCAIPAQCNFSGYKYPLEWISKIQSGQLNGISESDEFYIKNKSFKTNPKKIDRSLKWYVVLDAASYVASNRLNLSVHKPDFVTISFYKMFGWPTGLGALLVRNSSGHVLGNRQYFGGGTVNISIPSEPFHVKRSKLHERFEDGTISFLSILGIRHGLNALTKFFLDMDLIRTRTFRLAQYLYKNLRDMTYENGQRVVTIFSDTEYDSEKTQGPVVTFNLLRPNGEIIGYSEMEQIAYLHNVNLRYGCFCNPGACRRHLGLTSQQVLKHYESGHVCGDGFDIVDGNPTGAIRASIGYMTTKENIDFLLLLIFNCWIKPNNINQKSLKNHTLLQTNRDSNQNVQQMENSRTLKSNKLLQIFVYPIKSCAPFQVKSTWTIGPHGLLYDREWLIVNSNGVPLTAKREPKLCLIEPTIDISSRQLILHFHGDDDKNNAVVPLDISSFSKNYSVEAPLCNSKVCGDSIVGLDCGESVSTWLCRVLERSNLKLIRMSPDHHRKPRNSLDEISLANQSQFLLLSMPSLTQLARELRSNGVLSSLNIPTTASPTTYEENGRDLDEKINRENCNYLDDDAILQTTVVPNLIGRFRGNLVIGGSDSDDHVAYEEETWKGIRIGGTDFKCGGPCMRCATICMDPLTGTKSAEPFLTLSRIRGGRPNFGVHLYASSRPNDTDYNFTTTRTPFLQTLLIGSHYEVVDIKEEQNGVKDKLEVLRNID